MKKIILFTLIVLVSCKKKEVKPEPEPDPVPVCQTTNPVFAGQYRYGSGRDTGRVTVTFIKNNCPTANENYYLFHHVGEAVLPYVKQGSYFVPQDYTVLVNETTGTGAEVSSTHEFSVGKSGSVFNLVVTSSKIVGETITFSRIQ